VTIDNPNNFSVQLTYKANSIDVTVVLGTQAPPVSVTTDLWTGLGGDNNWSTAANWASGVAPVSGDDLIFAAGVPRLAPSNNFPIGTVFHSITFAGSGYTLTGNSLTLQGNATTEASVTTTNATGTNTIALPLVLADSPTFTSTYVGTTLTV